MRLDLYLFDADFSVIDELDDALEMTEGNVLENDDWVLPCSDALKNFLGQIYPYFLYVPTHPYFSLYPVFSKTNFTEKTEGLCGIQTWIVGDEGKHADHLITTTSMAPKTDTVAMHFGVCQSSYDLRVLLLMQNVNKTTMS